MNTWDSAVDTLVKQIIEADSREQREDLFKQLLFVLENPTNGGE